MPNSGYQLGKNGVLFYSQYSPFHDILQFSITKSYYVLSNTDGSIFLNQFFLNCSKRFFSLTELSQLHRSYGVEWENDACEQETWKEAVVFYVPKHLTVVAEENHKTPYRPQNVVISSKRYNVTLGPYLMRWLSQVSAHFCEMLGT